MSQLDLDYSRNKRTTIIEQGANAAMLVGKTRAGAIARLRRQQDMVRDMHQQEVDEFTRRFKATLKPAEFEKKRPKIASNKLTEIDKIIQLVKSMPEPKAEVVAPGSENLDEKA